MIDTTIAASYEESKTQLSLFKRNLGRSYRGRFVQIFFAMKFYQNDLPSMFSNQFVSTEVLQTLLDDLYSKASREPNDCVLMIFENRYLARTGLISNNNTTSQNTWRNNFNLQKGIGCYAPAQDLASNTFLDQSRIYCRYLQFQNSSILSGSSCSLCPTGAKYRNEDHRKWLRIDPGGNGYAVVDLNNHRNFTPYVAPNGQRIPLLPLIIALYHDADPGLITGNRQQVDTRDFLSDFNFSPEEAAHYFDDSQANDFNWAILQRFPDIQFTEIGDQLQIERERITSAGALRATRDRRTQQLPRRPTLTGAQVPPPGINTGWDAEQYVKRALEDNGWTVYDVSRQKLGYDLVIKMGRTTKYVEVKSSINYCTPTLTSREYQQAQNQRASYILAIIENFNPIEENTIFFIPDPVNACLLTENQVIQYSISRSTWSAASVPINEI